MCYECKASRNPHYKRHFVCWDCEIGWKSGFFNNLNETSRCRKCSKLGTEVPYSYRLPKRNKKAWSKEKTRFYQKKAELPILPIDRIKKHKKHRKHNRHALPELLSYKTIY